MQLPSSPHVPGQNWQGIAQVLSISDELGVYLELDDLLRHAVELARARLKLERVSIFLRDDENGLMRGSFGTGPSGETVDERWHAHPVTREQCEALRQLVPQGRLWNYYDDVELQVLKPRRKWIVGKGWNTTTPLLAAGKLVGVMYTDAALSGSAFDAERQSLAALLCGSLANLVRARQPGSMSESCGGPGRPTRMVRHALAALERDARVRGQELARELGVSPGHLARLFKNELGVSLVEYRNRLRLRSFFDHVEQGETNLIRAAHAAGFGSYAQFHRVYRQLLGGTPRDLIARTQPAKCAAAEEPPARASRK
jgi:AraC-like DNA-binding protein